MENILALSLALLFCGWIAAPAECYVQTLYQLPNSTENHSTFKTTEFNESVITASLCTEGSSTSEQQKLFSEHGKLMGYVRFYLLAQDIAPLEEPQMGKLAEFEGLLKLTGSIGWHDVTILSSNHSVGELESALEHAWKIEFDAYATARNISRSAMAIRIFWNLNEGDTLTTSGFPISRIVYMVAISDPGEIEKLHQTAPTNEDFRLIQRIPHPSKADFSLRMKEKGIQIYDKELFYASYLIVKGHPQSLNVSQLRNELVTELKSSQDAVQPPCVAAGTLDVLIRTPIHHVLISNSTNGSYSQWDVSLVYYHATTNDKVNIYWQSELEPEDSPIKRVSKQEIHQRESRNFSFNYYIQPGMSFRMYTSGPVNFQSFAQIEAVISKRLNQKLVREGQSVKVVIWNPDMNNTGVVDFFVVLETDDDTSFPLNPTLFYAQQIYAHLEGLKTGVGCYPGAVEHVREDVVLSSHPVPQTERCQTRNFWKDCQEGRITYGRAEEIYECPLQENFAIYLLARHTELPSDTVIEGFVKAAIAETNPLTIDNARFTVALTKQQPIFRTILGSSFNAPITLSMLADEDAPQQREPHIGQAVRFDFSLSLTNAPVNGIQNLWKFPLQRIAQELATYNHDIIIFHPDASFRLYTNPPISMQSLLAFGDQISQHTRVSVSDIVVWIPENEHFNGKTLDFFIIIPRGWVSNILPSKSQRGETVYRAILDGMSRDYYLSGAESIMRFKHGGVELNFLETNSSESGQANCAQNPTYAERLYACPLPRTFDLHLVYYYQRGRSNQRADLNSEAVLHAVGDAFNEANPLSLPGVNLTVGLTGRSDNQQTITGQTVTQFVFTLSYPEMDADKCRYVWRYPSDDIMTKHLQNTASAAKVTDSFFNTK